MKMIKELFEYPVTYLGKLRHELTDRLQGMMSISGIQAQGIRYLWSSLIVFSMHETVEDVWKMLKEQNSSWLYVVQKRENELRISVFLEPYIVRGVTRVSSRCVRN